MASIFDALDEKKGKDIRVLGDFISVFCREQHNTQDKAPFPVKDVRLNKYLGDKNLTLCKDCARLINHSIAKLLLCPYDPKPKCRKCETHCYAPGYRERIQEVMRFSGPYMIKHGRLDMLLHYLH
jgi:hypothetical protein